MPPSTADKPLVQQRSAANFLASLTPAAKSDTQPQSVPVSSLAPPSAASSSRLQPTMGVSSLPASAATAQSFLSSLGEASSSTTTLPSFVAAPVPPATQPVAVRALPQPTAQQVSKASTARGMPPAGSASTSAAGFISSLAPATSAPAPAAPSAPVLGNLSSPGGDASVSSPLLKVTPTVGEVAIEDFEQEAVRPEAASSNPAPSPAKGVLKLIAAPAAAAGAMPVRAAAAAGACASVTKQSTAASFLCSLAPTAASATPTTQTVTPLEPQRPTAAGFLQSVAPKAEKSAVVPAVSMQGPQPQRAPGQQPTTAGFIDTLAQGHEVQLHTGAPAPPLGRPVALGRSETPTAAGFLDNVATPQYSIASADGGSAAGGFLHSLAQPSAASSAAAPLRHGVCDPRASGGARAAAIDSPSRRQGGYGQQPAAAASAADSLLAAASAAEPGPSKPLNPAGGTPSGAGGDSPTTAVALPPEDSWDRLRRSQVVVAAPPDAPKAQPTAFCVGLLRAEGMRVPPPMAAAAAEAQRQRRQPPTVEQRVLLSFFDSQRGSFFGRTWEGPLLRVRQEHIERGRVDVEHDIDAFFVSRMLGPRCGLVLELAYKLRVADGAVSEHSAGWVLLRPFAQLGSITDVADGDHEVELAAGLQQGSPLALLHELPLRQGEGRVYYSLRSHRALLQASHLMLEHAIYSIDKTLPGLMPATVDGGIDLAGLFEPKLMPTLRLKLEAIRVHLPASLETHAASALFASLSSASGGGGGGGGGSIRSRRAAAEAAKAAASVRRLGFRLLLGAHSGHRLCSGEPTVCPLEIAEQPQPTADAAASTLSLRCAPSVGIVGLDGFALARSFGLVAELQAEFAVAAEAKEVRRQVPLAWGVALLFADGRTLREGRVGFDLSFGATATPISGLMLLEGGRRLREAAVPPRCELEVRASGWRSLVGELSSSESTAVDAFARKQESELRASYPAEGRFAEAAFYLAMEREAAAADAEEAEIDRAEAVALLENRFMSSGSGASGKHTRGEAELAKLHATKAARILTTGRENLKRTVFAGWSLVTQLRRRAKSRGHLLFQIHELRLLSALPQPSISELWLEVRPLVTRGPLRSARLPKSTRSIAVGMSEKLELLEGTVGAAALADALRSADEADSFVWLSLHGCSAGDTRTAELAYNHVSLQAILAAGADVQDEQLPLYAPSGAQLAEARISVRAVDAIRRLLHLSAKEVGGDGETLEPRATRDGKLDDELAATNADVRPKAAAEAAMAALVANLPARSVEELMQLATLATAQPHSASAVSRADKAAMWDAAQRLDAAATAAPAASPHPLPPESEWHTHTVHNVLFQFVSYAPLPSPTRSRSHATSQSIYLTFQLYHFGPRTTPRALLQPAGDAVGRGLPSRVGAGRTQRADADADVVRVEVGDLALSPKVRSDGQLGDVWVETEMPGLEEEPQLRTETRRIGSSGRTNFGFSHSVQLHVGNRRAALQRALRATAASDAEVVFTLCTKVGRARRELGSASINLQSVLREGRDAPKTALELTAGPLGAAGSLQVGVIAMEALRALAPAADSAVAASGRGDAADSLKTTGASGCSGDGGRAGGALPAEAEDLMLVAADEKLAREGPGLVESFLLSPPDEASDGNADSDAQAARQLARFREYLAHKSVYVDVWDGGSLLQIGTARVPLAALLRQGTTKRGPASTVREYVTADVFSTQLTSIDAAPSVDAAAASAPQILGRLKLVLARLSVGNRSTGFSAQSAARAGDRSGEAPLRPTAQRSKVRLRALPTGSANVMRAREPTAAEESALYQRQLRRQKQREWLRAHGAALAVSPLYEKIGGVSGGASLRAAPGSVARSLELGMGQEESLARARLQLQMRSLRAAEQFRSQHRPERLRQLLAESVQHVRYVYPYYGSVEFVELPFRNPYSAEHCFTISWEDPLQQFSIVSSVDEWRALKARFGLSTPAEDQLVLRGQRLWLMPQELVYIPFKFQAWQFGQVRPDFIPATGTDGGEPRDAEAASASAPIARRTIDVELLNVQGEQVTSLELRVRPQPYVIDQTFRFHQPEHDFLKTTIRLHGTRWHATAALQHLQSAAANRVTAPPPPPPLPPSSALQPSVWVRCSNPDVVASVHEQRTVADPVEVSLKYRCGASPSVGRFLLLIFDDVWMHEVRETWEIVVHSLQRIDMHALVSQTSRAKVTLKGDSRAARGLVQCFSSAPEELQLHPEAPFALSAATVHEVGLQLRPMRPGRQQYVVHAVELQRRVLVSSWLVCAVSRIPAITKSFALSIPSHHGANRKVALSNPYTYDASFLLYTDSPDVLSFKQNVLPIPAGETRYIGLKFAAAASGIPSTQKVLVFVNNADDKNEECMEIAVVYSDMA